MRLGPRSFSTSDCENVGTDHLSSAVFRQVKTRTSMATMIAHAQLMILTAAYRFRLLMNAEAFDGWRGHDLHLMLAALVL